MSETKSQLLYTLMFWLHIYERGSHTSWVSHNPVLALSAWSQRRLPPYPPARAGTHQTGPRSDTNPKPQVATSTSDQTARNQTSSFEICRNSSQNSEKLFDLLDQWFTITRETWNSPMEETYEARDGEGLRAGPRPIPAPVRQPGSSLNSRTWPFYGGFLTQA